MTNQTDTTASHPAGILLESVGSYLDSNGIHPLYDTGLPDLHKDMTVAYSEIEFFEFVQMMTDKDVALYKVALKEYAPTSKQTFAWVDETWRKTV